MGLCYNTRHVYSELEVFQLTDVNGSGRSYAKMEALGLPKERSSAQCAAVFLNSFPERNR